MNGWEKNSGTTLVPYELGQYIHRFPGDFLGVNIPWIEELLSHDVIDAILLVVVEAIFIAHSYKCVIKRCVGVNQALHVGSFTRSYAVDLVSAWDVVCDGFSFRGIQGSLLYFGSGWCLPAGLR